MTTAIRQAVRGRTGMLAFLALLGALGLAGCAQGPRQAQGQLDTPEHHAQNGFEMIDQERWADAEREFNLALSLDKNYGPAYSGLAIFKAHAATDPTASAKDRERWADQANDLAKEGLSKVKGDDPKRAAHVARLRVITYLQMPADGWLKKALSEYEDAVELDRRKLDPDPDFFIARSYRAAYQWQKSQEAYQRSMRIAPNGPRAQQASDEMRVVQKIVLADPESGVGKQIAILPAISRADVAALLVQELRLAKLYQRGNTSRFDTGFQAPQQPGGQMQVDLNQRLPEASDISKHALRSDIEEVMRLGVDGLMPYANRTFEPDKKLSRAEFALVIVDVLVRVSGDSRIKAEYFGEPHSTIPDMAPSNPFYSSTKTALTRNLMEPKSRIDGTFGPQDPVSGADALSSIKEMKRAVASYVK